MLHIILLILKIIGIILLCILGIMLLAITCTLFVPVRYRVRLVREEGEGKPPFTAYVKVTWLLHLVNILVRYPAEVILRVRIMLFTLIKLPKKEKKSEKKAKRTEKKAVAEEREKETTESPIQTNVTEIQTQTKTAKPVTQPEDANISQNNVPESHEDDHYEAFESNFPELEDTTDAEQEPAATDEGFGSKEKFSLTEKIRGILDKIKQIVEKIKALFENIQYTIRKFCDKIKSVLDNIEYYRELLESKPFKQSLQLCQSELKAVFKALKPDKFEADITVGMDDPATTGQILAIYGMLYPFIGQNVQITGDFEQTHVEGNIYIRGKIRAFTFLRTAIRVYFNKDFRKLIKLLKKEAV